MTAYTPEGGLIDGKIVAAQYGDVLVVATTDRIDTSANQLVGLGFGDLAELWRLRCADGSPSGSPWCRPATTPTSVTSPSTRTEPTVVATCEDKILRFDPLAGPS